MVNMRTIELSVGAFMLVGLGALAVLAFRVSGLSIDSTRPTYRLVADFDNVSGLTDRAKVSTAGVVVGRVHSIRLDPASFRARVEMDVFEDAGKFPEDSIAAIQTQGLLGEKYISISVGGAEEVLENGGKIDDTQSSLVLEDLIGKVLANLTSKPAAE